MIQKCHLCWFFTTAFMPVPYINLVVTSNISAYIFFFTVYLFLREKKRVHKWGMDRERGERESQVGSALSAQSLMWGSNSQTMRSQPEPKPRVGCLTNWATHVPPEFTFKHPSDICNCSVMKECAIWSQTDLFYSMVGLLVSFIFLNLCFFTINILL